MFRRLFRRGKAQSADTPSELPEEGHELQMGLFDHLNELRIRLFRAGIAIVIGTLIGFAFAGGLLEYLREPYCQSIEEASESCRLLIIDPTGGVIVYFRVALLIGGILAIPIVTYQVLMFVVPGLTAKERRYLLMSMPAITGLFLIGLAFAWFMLMPPAMYFLQNFENTQFRSEWTADLYLSFVTSLLFWMGVAFETPLIFFILSVMGIVTPRALAQNWRIAVVGAAVAAAFITPTIDPVNMFLVMGPLLALYLLSIFLVAIGSRINRPAP